MVGDDKAMNESLESKVAIVTGGSHGYGTGIAASLKKSGCRVYTTGRDLEALQKISQENQVKAIQADVTEPRDWDKLVNGVLEEEGRVDILVNNAGAGVAIKELERQTDDEISRAISTNLTGAIYGCRRVVGIMKEQKSGIIINIASVCAENAWPTWSVYSAAKAGIVQFSKCLYTELRESNIRVTAIIPSWGDTRFSEASNIKGAESDPSLSPRIMKPADMGDLVVSICQLPSHLVVPYLRVQPLVQEFNPM
jgi:NADP-dependent 3-hydroxy acid dehydrogenase YdfG